MGDLNTSLQKCGPSTGLPDYAIDGRRSQGPIYRDSAQLHNLIRIYDMIALNTWKHDLGPTFQFENKHSRIDFIFCKRHLVDAGAREAHYLQHFPLLKLTGAIHYPVLCTVLKGMDSGSIAAFYVMEQSPTEGALPALAETGRPEPQFSTTNCFQHCGLA